MRQHALPPHSGRAIVLLGMVGLLALLATSGGIHRFVTDVTERSAVAIEDRPVLGAVMFVLASIVSATLTFFSTAALIPVAIQAWGKLATFALLWLGWLIGGMLAYLVGKYPGHAILGWLIAKRRLQQYEANANKIGGFGAALLFQLALPSEVPAYVLGAVRFPMRTYLAVLMIAELPFALGAVYLADTFVRGDVGLLILLGFAGVALSWLAAHKLHQLVSRPSCTLKDEEQELRRTA